MLHNKSHLPVTQFTVEGRGDFPLDMLRYDAAWPVSGDDAAGLRTPDDAGNGRERRTVTLRTVSRAITLARWASFGWYITSIDDNPDHPLLT